MRVYLNGKSFEDICLARFDELLEAEDEETDMLEDEEREFDKLSEWYECYIDFAEACSRLEAYYAEIGVEFVK